MTATLEVRTESPVVEVHLSGKLSKEDYQHFAPELERQIEQHGKINLLVFLEDFHGWSAGALWEDIKFDVKHFSDIARLAIVGERKWEKGMAKFCQPFTTAEVRYFDRFEADEAQAWISRTNNEPST